MEDLLQQATLDFESFLSGHKAPALVGHSLMTIMKNDVRTIAHITMTWAVKQTSGALPQNLMQARNKVFDIFFYRVIKFEGIYKFFPLFEEALLQFCPPNFRGQLTALFTQYSWQDIRPIGDIKQQPVFALEKRTAAEVKEEQFNEDVYKNVTHNILALESRFTFADEQQGAEMAQHTARISTLFKDFVGLVKDKDARREIIIANEGDKDAMYENKKKFNLDDYIAQCLDLTVAFFNDDYLLQSVQMMDLLVDLAQSKGVDLEKHARFQAKFNMFSTRKIEEYTASKTNRFLVRSILGLFTGWYPGPLLDQLLAEENRRTRRVILNVLECYGYGIYETLVHDLTNCTDQTPWYYIRNLIFLFGKIVTNDPMRKNQVVELVDRHLNPKSTRQVNLQCISTLSFLATDQAADRLIEKLAVFRKLQDPVSVDLTNKIALALANFEADKALETAIEFAQKNWSNEFAERFSQVTLPNKVVANLTSKIRAEVKKMKFSFSLLGNVDSALNLLKALAYTRSDDVANLCKEITTTLPASNTLHTKAASILSQVTVPPPPMFSPDKSLNRLAIAKNIPELALYVHEAGMTGKLRVRTVDQVDCSVDFGEGEALYAGISAQYVDQENAFFWTFLLEPRDVAQVTFGPKSGGTGTLSGLQLEKATERLIHEGLVQKGEVQQIVGSEILPDSRFSQRPVGAYFLQFKDADDPAKCRLVWQALKNNPDINILQQVTRLGKYDLYKVLFYMLKQNMIEIDAHKKSHEINSAINDSLSMLITYLQRIERKPVLFNAYKAASEVCEDIVTNTQDEVVRFAMDVMRKYFWNAYATRQIFVTANLAICQQVISLVETYAKTKSADSKEALLSYIEFSFQEQDTALAPPPPPEPEPNILQKIENIEFANDAFDEFEIGFDEDSINDMFGVLENQLHATGADLPTFGQDAGLTEHEEQMLMELYDNIAVAYVKPLKDFIREIKLNLKINRQTSLEWIEMVEPSVNLLFSSAEKMGYTKICDSLGEMQRVFQDQKMVPDLTYLLDDAVQGLLFYYDRLSMLLPKTFALDLSDNDLNSKKEVLIVKFILKQIPEINEKMMNRIILAGLSTFDKFMHSSPDEISAVTGLSKRHGEDVFMKFYQYRHIYYRHDDDEYKDKFLQMFDVKFNILREIHLEIESILASNQADKEENKARVNSLKMDRQRTLWAIFILLCIKEEYDLIEAVQQAVYDVRLQKLEEYLNHLTTL